MQLRQLPLKTFAFVALFILAHFSHHLLTALVIPMLPLIRDSFGLNYTTAGLVAAAFTFSNGLGQLPAGWLADKIGPRKVLTVGVAGVALAGALVGLSQGMFWLILFLILMGLAGGGYHPAAPPLIINAVGAANRGRALGFHVMGGSMSHFLAPVVGVGLAAIWGWRGAFLGTALPVFIFGMLFYVLLGRIAGTGRPVAVNPGVSDGGGAGEVIEAGVASHSLDRAGSAVKSGFNAGLAAFIYLTSLATSFVHASIVFVPLIMIDRFGASEQAAALTLSLVYSAGFWGAPLGGFLSDRLGPTPVLIAVCLLLVPVLFLLTLIPYGFVTYLLMLALGAALFMRMPVSEAFIVENVSVRRRSTILGIYYAAGMVGGGVLTPIIGAVADRFGFVIAFGATALLYAVMMIPSLPLLWLYRKRKTAA
jgi:MFS family permease